MKLGVLIILIVFSRKNWFQKFNVQHVSKAGTKASQRQEFWNCESPGSILSARFRNFEQPTVAVSFCIHVREMFESYMQSANAAKITYLNAEQDCRWTQAVTQLGKHPSMCVQECRCMYIHCQIMSCIYIYIYIYNV